MLRVLVLLSAVCVTRGSICCVPRQWEGNEGSELGLLREGAPYPNFIQSSVNVAYDADNQKVAATQYIDVDGTQIMVKSIMDYKHGVQYSINGTKCTRTTLPTTFVENCIPDGAKETQTIIGAGGKTMNLRTYTMMVGSSPGQFIHMGTSFTGITPGISDRTIFNPPVSCMMGPIYPAEIQMMKRVSFLHPLR
uniref:Uncharacterized protein n=1 Tax=Magallana gigas TaxID=29159 RepID=A0A8W8LRJ5_MAGGI